MEQENFSILRYAACSVSSHHPVFPNIRWSFIFMFLLILIQLFFHQLFLIFNFIFYVPTEPKEQSFLFSLIWHLFYVVSFPLLSLIFYSLLSCLVYLLINAHKWHYGDIFSEFFNVLAIFLLTLYITDNL